jgi:hypothetical protein
MLVFDGIVVIAEAKSWREAKLDGQYLAIG